MINEKYSMLIKYKTRRTIIVLSPNVLELVVCNEKKLDKDCRVCVM